MSTSRPSSARGRRWTLLVWACWSTSAVLVLGLAALAGWLARSGWVTSTDRGWTQLVVGLRGDGATAVLRWVTLIGDPRVVLPLAGMVGVVLVLRHRYAPALLVATSSAGALGLTLLAKWIVARERPGHGALVDTLGAALPSGHSALTLACLGAMATVAGGALHRRYHRVALWAIVIAAAAAVGFSRVYLGAHWPTDVALGWVIGAWWLASCTVAVRSLLPGQVLARRLET